MPSQHHGCIELHQILTARIIKLAWRRGNSESATSPMMRAAADQPLELLCEDHVGTYVVPFLCRWTSGVWQSVATSTPIEVTVLAGARVDGIGCSLSFPVHGRTNEVERNGRL